MRITVFCVEVTRDISNLYIMSLNFGWKHYISNLGNQTDEATALVFKKLTKVLIQVFFCSKTSSEFIESRKAELGCELVGSWTVSVGDMDQALHLWRYVGGFEKIDKAKILFRENPVSGFSLNPSWDHIFSFTKLACFNPRIFF